MPLLYIRTYTRDLIKAHPEWLFVFGDNLKRTGLGGQAGAARGEPNAVGIATKRSPGMRPCDFFCDSDKREWERHSAKALTRLQQAIASGGAVIWPLDGIGTGLAELPERAPHIHQAIEEFRQSLERASLASPEHRYTVFPRISDQSESCEW